MQKDEFEFNQNFQKTSNIRKVVEINVSSRKIKVNSETIESKVFFNLTTSFDEFEKKLKIPDDFDELVKEIKQEIKLEEGSEGLEKNEEQFNHFSRKKFFLERKNLFDKVTKTNSLGSIIELYSSNYFLIWRDIFK